MAGEYSTTAPLTGPYVKPTPLPSDKQGGNSTLDKDSFLKLLVAQLKYQDPMKPADSTALMQQSAAFSMVESLQNMQASQDTATMSALDATGTTFVGKNITALAADNVTKITGMVTGVRFTSDGPILTVGNTEVPLTRVTAVGTVAVTDTPTDDPATA